MKMAKGCLTPLVLLLVILSASCSAFFLLFSSIPAAILLVFFPSAIFAAGIFFFRDPDVPLGEGIISPADGIVHRVYVVNEITCVSIFMNIHNIHVNRAPLAGRIEKREYHPGSHLPAYQKDSDRNERMCWTIRGDYGVVEVVQIAGLLARRIVPYLEEGDAFSKGGKIGLIRFGSRVDVFLCPGAEAAVNEGARIRVGETIALLKAAKEKGGTP